MKAKYSKFDIGKRLSALLVLIIFLFTAIIIRLSYIAFAEADKLTTRAMDEWTRDIPTVAKRGIVYDRNGIVLSDTSTVYTIYVRPSGIKNLDSLCANLANALGVPASAINKKITGKRASEITIARKVDRNVMTMILSGEHEGVYFSQDIKRVYPYGDFMSQILGFIGIDNAGQTGVEAYYNRYLSGVNGYAYTETDLIGRETGKTSYVDPISGLNLTLTLDYTIQALTENAVKKAALIHQAKSAYCIVMDPQTGEVLALAESPSFDLNNVPRDNLEALLTWSKVSSVSNVYEPGSTYKILTMSAALDSGAKTTDYNLYCPGYRMVDGKKIKCWRTTGHGSETFEKGVQNSCNCLFMDLALSMGTDTFYSYIDLFGIGKKTGIDISGEGAGLLIKEEQVKPVDLARIGFGQAVAVTPIELITACSAVINGGTLFTPHILKSADTEDGKNIYTAYPSSKHRVISENTSKTVTALLYSAVENGSGRNAKVAGYQIGGKTGTAQKYENGAIAQGKYISSFLGFAPANDPKYAILMIVDEPVGVYYGSIVAAPYVGDIFRGIFSYAGIEATGGEAPVYFTMPNLIGKSLTEAASTLTKLGIYWEVDGEGVVISQLPAEGSQVTKNTVALLSLG